MLALSLLLVLLCLLQVAQSLHWATSLARRTRSATFLSRNSGRLFADIDDEDERRSFKRIATNYLTAKFIDCRGDDCKAIRSKDEVMDLLKVVLPPVSKSELEREVEVVMKKIGAAGADIENIEPTEYVRAVLDNGYWADAGPFVVKELVFLDCLHTFYGDTGSNSLLNDDDYDELKEMLTWEGSVAASLNAKEARFIYAVASARRGDSIMSDVDYTQLKAELNESGSWVVKREQDPLEKLGVSTFMGYLHRSL